MTCEIEFVTEAGGNLTCNVVWCVVCEGKCLFAVKTAIAAPVASRVGCKYNIIIDFHANNSNNTITIM